MPEDCAGVREQGYVLHQRRKVLAEYKKSGLVKTYAMIIGTYSN